MSRTGLVALIVANLFVALQIMRHEWGYYETILIFWLEVVVLGLYSVLRMMVVGVFGAAPLGTWVARWVDLGSRLNRFIYTAIGVGFFVVKFGGFTLVIGLFVLLLPAALQPDGEGGGATILGREYERLNILGLAFWPYARMSIVGGVLLLGIAIARLMPGVGRQTAFAVTMVLLKLAADAVSHSLEHRWFVAERL